MSEAPQKYSQLFQAGRMEEFMRHTREDIHEIKGGVSQLRKEMVVHSQQATSTAQDIGEVKAAMQEMHSCIKDLHNKHEGTRGKWKHIGIGAVVTVTVLSFAVAVAAGSEGNLLTTLSRILGVLM